MLEAFETGDAPVDRLLAAWGRSHRFAGSKDRAAIADLVHAVLRRRRSLSWPLREETPRAALIGLAASEPGGAEALFSGARHGPAPLTAAERAALAEPPPPPPDPVRLDYPDWLDGLLRESLGAAFEPAMAALRARAPLDLRVNLLKATPAEAADALAAEGVETAPGPHAATCLRAAPGAPVARTAAYETGLVEPQDAASQAAAAFAGARPGDAVLDYCAGGGGKALAFAAASGGEGRVLAWDRAPERMRDLPARAARAGARIEALDAAARDALAGACDVVFVDAPCSGSGSWRRDPGGKWRLTPARLAALAETQAALLAEAARFVRPGGRLVHAVCSMLAVEGDPPAPPGFAPAGRLRLTTADDADGFTCVAFTGSLG